MGARLRPPRGGAGEVGGGARAGAAGALSAHPQPARRPGAPVVRPAAVADLAAIAAIERASFADAWSRPAFAALLGRREVYFVVAVPPASDGSPGAAEPVLGYAVAWFVVGEGEVANIAVHPEWRGQGIGAALLDDVLAAAALHDVTAVFLEVRESNEPARSLYTSRGFRQVGRRRNYYRAPREDALLLRWDVPPAGA
ncbi:MAG TPA: ribosomal protein S18-alanine N-acetyltransferase [Gemmatimonadaceae bacterium]|nr:ribosomal protein S18-alanine N-acetyltransferase [Gemmatimonadaceae bacterium]